MFRLFDETLVMLLLLAGSLPLVAACGVVTLRLTGRESLDDLFWAALFIGAASVAVLGTIASLLAVLVGWGV